MRNLGNSLPCFFLYFFLSKRLVPTRSYSQILLGGEQTQAKIKLDPWLMRGDFSDTNGHKLSMKVGGIRIPFNTVLRRPRPIGVLHDHVFISSTVLLQSEAGERICCLHCEYVA